MIRWLELRLGADPAALERLFGLLRRRRITLHAVEMRQHRDRCRTVRLAADGGEGHLERLRAELGELTDLIELRLLPATGPGTDRELALADLTLRAGSGTRHDQETRLHLAGTPAAIDAALEALRAAALLRQVTRDGTWAIPLSTSEQ